MGNTTNKSVKKDYSPKTKENRNRQNNKEDENQHHESYRQYSSQQSLLSFSGGRFNWSFRGSQRTYSSASTRPWSRVSRRKFNDVTLADPINLSKTCWPVPYIESIFLPHFKICNDDFEKKFEIRRNLARGAFGKVYCICGKNSDSNNVELALKVLSKAQIIRDGTLSQIKDEVDIQTICGHHPFIVQCIDFWQNRRNIFLLSEYIPNGELFETIKVFTYQLIQLYVCEISIAIDFLHNAGIVYRDLKPENILLDTNYHIKLTDFGLSKWLKFGNRTSTICGTLQYMAPEILAGELYGHAVDWWALGVIACRMMTDKYPLLPYTTTANYKDEIDRVISISTSSESQIKTITGAIPKPSKAIPQIELQTSIKNNPSKKQSVLPEEANTIDPALKDLLNRLLETNPQYRLKSVLALERIALYKNFKIEDVRNRKILPRNFMDKDITSHHLSSSTNDSDNKKSNSSVIKCIGGDDDQMVAEHYFKEF